MGTDFMGVPDRAWDALAAMEDGTNFDFDDGGTIEFFAVTNPDGVFRVEYEDYDLLVAKGWLDVTETTVAVSETGSYWMARYLVWAKKNRKEVRA